MEQFPTGLHLTWFFRNLIFFCISTFNFQLSLTIVTVTFSKTSMLAVQVASLVFSIIPGMSFPVHLLKSGLFPGAVAGVSGIIGDFWRQNFQASPLGFPSNSPFPASLTIPSFSNICPAFWSFPAFPDCLYQSTLSKPSYMGLLAISGSFGHMPGYLFA